MRPDPDHYLRASVIHINFKPAESTVGANRIVPRKRSRRSAGSRRNFRSHPWIALYRTENIEAIKRVERLGPELDLQPLGNRDQLIIDKSATYWGGMRICPLRSGLVR